MSRKLISASKVGLLSKCRYPFRKAAEWHDNVTAAAEQGKILHARAENYLLGKPYVHSSHDGGDGRTDTRWEALRKWLDGVRTNTTVAEVSYAWDPTTGKGRITGSNRAYVGIRAGEICGTADLVDPGVTPILVCDFKSGQLNISAAEMQLSTLAVMAADVYGVDSVRITIVHVDNVLTEYTRVLTAVDLAAHAGLLHQWITEAELSKPTPGPHCSEMYCPHISFCPETTKPLQDLIPTEALVARHRFGVDITDPAHAAFCLEKLEAIKKMADQVETALKAKAKEWGGIPLSGGLVYKPVNGQRASTNTEALRKLAKKLGATAADLAECEQTTTYQSFRKVRA